MWMKGDAQPYYTLLDLSFHSVGVTEFGIVLSDSGTLLRVFNNLVALFCTKNMRRYPSHVSRIKAFTHCVPRGKRLADARVNLWDKGKRKRSPFASLRAGL